MTLIIIENMHNMHIYAQSAFVIDLIFLLELFL